MFIYVHTHWPEQHLFARSFRETNLRRKGNQSFCLFSVLCSLDIERKCSFYDYLFLCIVVAIICKLLDLAQVNTRRGTMVYALYVQQ